MFKLNFIVYVCIYICQTVQFCFLNAFKWNRVVIWTVDHSGTATDLVTCKLLCSSEFVLYLKHDLLNLHHSDHSDILAP